MDLAIQFILQLAPIRATDDYAHALAYLIEYWEWDIDAYRSYLNPNIRADNTYIVLCALMLLAMVELMHLRYSGLTSEELQGRIRAIGPRTFAILAAIPRLGVIIIRIVEIVVIADSPAVACSLIVASMFPVLMKYEGALSIEEHHNVHLNEMGLTLRHNLGCDGSLED
ncbi:hypothetical protein F5J12DRAFT_928542 [Pisolithus orientalis]|uniref:uncharacterized protein n=1 Tax=Pisolithus orientalis TaxID=936130 RepID=UPI0022259FDC|nr:uncharacterized protein F5J12DRAFT_928542 [Pisolithus orientalis]KAI6000353.1 hypothetical protein F5J12DRAFT_928542 [Pisolithus orientalis]